MKNELATAIVYGDRHTGLESPICDKILKKYISKNKKSITHIIDLGDIIDNPFMSDFPVIPKYRLTSQEEFDIYTEHLISIRKIIPDVKIYIIPGNHDFGRLEKSKRLKRGIASLKSLDFSNILFECFDRLGLDRKNVTIAKMKQVIKFNKNYSALFTHGDPMIDPNIKGGATGVRRTGETYPFEGDIFMGHGHRHIEFSRDYPGQRVVMVGGMFDVEAMKKMYLSFHPYENGFGVIKYNKEIAFFQYYEIKEGKAVIDGKLYD